MNYNKSIYDYFPFHQWVMRACFPPPPALIGSQKSLEQHHLWIGGRCQHWIDDLAKLLRPTGQVLLPFTHPQSYFSTWVSAKHVNKGNVYLLVVKQHYKPQSCHQKDLKQEDGLEMPLKSFLILSVWEMLSLVGEMRSNDIRDVKAIAWGMTARGRKETNSATYQFMTL